MIGPSTKLIKFSRATQNYTPSSQECLTTQGLLCTLNVKSSHPFFVTLLLM